MATVGIASSPSGQGYWLADSEGHVSAFGDALTLDAAKSWTASLRIVSIASNPREPGYWLADASGGVFAFGDAPLQGSAAQLSLARPIVAMAASPSGKGYWLADADGGVFAFGDAPFLGSVPGLGGTPVAKPIVGMAVTPSGQGYWLVAKDGATFAFGDARVQSDPRWRGIKDEVPVVAIATNFAGSGYWLAAADGDVFSFGDAPALGRVEEQITHDEPIVAMAASPKGDNYWLVTRSGRVFAFGERLDVGSLLAGFSPDTVAGKDRLGVRDDVRTLCSVLGARSVEPPLSVGLFGEWGSGKSFFMEMMKRRIKEIADLSAAAEARGEATLYCSQVRQITFNAWHYADGNLWANLVTHIFDRLADPEPHLGNRWSEKEKANLVSKLRLVKEEQRQVGARVHALTKEKEAIQQGLSDLEEERKTVEQEAARVQSNLSRVIEYVEDTDAVQNKVSAFTSALGNEAHASLEDATRLAQAAGSLWGAVRQTLRLLEPGRQRRVRMLILAILGGTLLLPAVAVSLLNQYSAELRVLVAGAGCLLPPLLSATRGLLWVNEAVGTAEAAAAEAERAARMRREKLEAQAADLNRHLDAIQAKEVELAREAQLKSAEVERVTQELAEVTAGRGLLRFIQQRSASADYRQHLGIVALIRQDFDVLTDLLGTQHKEVGVPRIDRIVLYIDDLDRCPPDRVVEVLQAVHLLLALPLFIVVVGVDPRWLLRSLERHYAEVLTAPNPEGLDEISDGQGLSRNLEVAHWQSTPAHYLEKIFQIPYTLPLMKPKSFRGLIKDLVSIVPAEEAQPLEDVPTVDVEAMETRPAMEGAEPMAASVGGDEPRQREETAESIDLTPRALLLTNAELTFMGHLGQMIANPREAKRLTNVYRLLKASVLPSELADFEAHAHQAALTLLGVLIAFPDRAGRLFGEIRARRDDEPWKEFVEALDPAGQVDRLSSDEGTGTLGSVEVSPSEELHSALEALLSHLTLPDRLKPFRDWAPRVARYSFRPARELEVRNHPLATDIQGTGAQTAG